MPANAARTVPANRGSLLPRLVLAIVAAGELLIAAAFFFAPHAAFALLGRPVLDPVVSRQYGLFLCSVALMYALIAADPIAFRRFIWIGVIQRGFELTIALIDWRAGELPTSAFLWLAGIEIVAALALATCARPPDRSEDVDGLGRDSRESRQHVWLVRALIGFGGLQLFWAFCSTVFVQFGARLLGWKLQDAYTTQQQGIALLIIGLASILTATDVRRYRRFIWVPLSSQMLGIVNAINELRLGSISLTVALIQWAIQAIIIAVLGRLSAMGTNASSAITPIAVPLSESPIG